MCPLESQPGSKNDNEDFSSPSGELSWRIEAASSPLVAAAVHDGNRIREELQEFLAISDADRLREEDPFTGRWTEVAPTRIVALKSRFEMDLNRPRERAIYRVPEDAWGLETWAVQPSPELLGRSLNNYDRFYSEVKETLKAVQEEWGHFCVFDFHSYNHRRAGPDGPVADPLENPEVNIGSESIIDPKWRPLVHRFIEELRHFEFLGRKLDVRENIKFRGGQFPRWVNANFPNEGCALAIEFKKFFMDEWTGEELPGQLDAIKQALASTVPGVLEELEKLR